MFKSNKLLILLMSLTLIVTAVSAASGLDGVRAEVNDIEDKTEEGQVKVIDNIEEIEEQETEVKEKSNKEEKGREEKDKEETANAIGVAQCTPKTDNIYDFDMDGNAEKGGLEKRDKAEIEAELNQKVADSMINISMNMAPVFENGQSEGNLMIVNEEINNYPQVIEIYKKGTNELIYKSGGVPVGSKIEYAKLDVDLEKGVYDCVAYFNAVNAETKEFMGKAGAEIKITVNN